MINLPEVNLSIEPLTRMLYGAIPGKFLLMGVELKVFSHLTEPRSAELPAREISSPPEYTQLFLDGLVANELLSSQGWRRTYLTVRACPRT